MLEIIDPTKIVRDHLKTLESEKTRSIHLPYVILFFGTPIVSSTLAIYLDLRLDKDAVNLFVTIFSIFIGLLFNLLLLIFDIKQKAKDKNSLLAQQVQSNQPVIPPSLGNSQVNYEKLSKVLKQVYSSISFAILISIFDIILLLLHFIGEKFNQRILVQAISWISYYFMIVFVLTLMMILKRVYLLIDQEIR